MQIKFRFLAALTLALAFAGSMAYAEDGASLYKTKCASCHGANGTPNPGMAKMMGIKPANDPAVKKLSEAQVAAIVKGGKGKMKPVAGLNDGQVKAVVAYYKGLK
jgi:mono/diheme cytochrome c family protein